MGKKKASKKSGKMVMCERCKEREAHHVHHKDHNHKNNKPSNRENLCTLCHGEEHGISPKVSELRFHLVHYERAQQLRIMISNNIGMSSMPNSPFRKSRCPDDEIGRNSVAA